MPLSNNDSTPKVTITAIIAHHVLLFSAVTWRALIALSTNYPALSNVHRLAYLAIRINHFVRAKIVVTITLLSAFNAEQVNLTNQLSRIAATSKLRYEIRSHIG
jgi:hypothetical protein